MESITVPRHHYLTVLEMAAELAGTVVGESVVRDGDFLHPGDPFGTIISEANNHGFEAMVTVQFMQGLRGAVSRAGGTPPTLDEVLNTLPYAINDARYPDLEVKALVDRLRGDVPEIYGSEI